MDSLFGIRFCLVLLVIVTTHALSEELVTPILVSPVGLSSCNSTKTQTCDKNTRDSQRYRDLCELQCGTGERIICKDHPDLGMIHFCFPKEQCPAGYLRSLIANVLNKMVTARYELCPIGHFKPPTDCYEQCRPCITMYPIPDDIVVFFKGDSFSPAKVYCNYKQGFFNWDNVTEINMTYYYNGFCENVKNLRKYPCISGQYLLPNGSCIHPCPDGYDRDDSDLKFLCKPLKVEIEHRELATEQIPTIGRKPVVTSDINRGPQGDDDNTGPHTATRILVPAYLIAVACILILAVMFVTFLKSKGYLVWMPWFTFGATPTIMNQYVKGNYIEINKSSGVHINGASSNSTIDNDSEESDFSNHSNTDVYIESSDDNISELKQVQAI